MTCTSMTSLASMPGTAVDPMWSMRTARCPQAVLAVPRCGAPDRARTGRAVPEPGVRRAGSPPSRLCANGRIRWCHSARACSTNSSVLPELSSQTSATARRCSSVACAAIRARASCSEKPRCSINRFTRRSSSALTITTNGNIGAIPDSTRSGMSSTITGVAARAAAINSDTAFGHQRMHDAVQRLALLVVAEGDRGQRRPVE